MMKDENATPYETETRPLTDTDTTHQGSLLVDSRTQSDPSPERLGTISVEMGSRQYRS